MPEGYENSVFCLRCSHIQRIGECPSCISCGSMVFAPVPVFLPKPTETTIYEDKA